MKSTYEPFIMLAPMEGVIDAVTRSFYSKMGGFDRLVTEFVRVTDKLLPKHVFYKYAPELKTNGKTPEGLPVFLQLLGGQATVLAENAHLACELGAPGIDLNFGCPAPTVNRHDGGATLLKNPSRLFDIVSAVRRAVPNEIPVTAKVRLGFDHKNYAIDIAQAVASANASTLTVHARTRAEGYKPPAHWEYIAQMKDAVKNLPVIANGEIWTKEDYLRCVQVSGCKDIALGRGAIARPDLALQIRAQLNEENYDTLTWANLETKLLPEFSRASYEYRDSGYAVARTKQWIRLLARNYPEAETKFQQIKLVKNYYELTNYYGDSLVQ
jgi:tRNA-dihydrouridine synthase C